MSARGALRLAAIAVLLAICLAMYALARPFGGAPFWVSFFLRNTGRLLGLRVAIAGRPLGGRTLYAANHSSWLDILALGGTRYTRFIAKSEIAGWPLVGLLARLAGTVFVSRERRSATREQADAVATALGEGAPLALFAEGGTGDGVTLKPFRPALFAAASEASAQVQPVAIDFGARGAEMAWPAGTSFSTELKRMLNRPGATLLTLHYLPPLDARGLDRKALAAQAEAGVARVLGLPDAR